MGGYASRRASRACHLRVGSFPPWRASFARVSIVAKLKAWLARVASTRSFGRRFVCVARCACILCSCGKRIGIALGARCPYRCLIVFRQGKSCTTQCQLSTLQILARIAGRQIDGTRAACRLGSFRKNRPLPIRLDLGCKARILKTLALKTRMICKGCTLESRRESMCCAGIRRMNLSSWRGLFPQGTFRSCASLGLSQTFPRRISRTLVRVTRQRSYPQGSLYILCLRVALARGGKLGGTGALPW